MKFESCACLVALCQWVSSKKQQVLAISCIDAFKKEVYLYAFHVDVIHCIMP